MAAHGRQGAETPPLSTQTPLCLNLPPPSPKPGVGLPAPPPSCRIFTVPETLIFSPSRNHSPFTSPYDASQVKTALSPSRTWASCRSCTMRTWRSVDEGQGARVAKGEGEQVAQGLGVRVPPAAGWLYPGRAAWRRPGSRPRRRCRCRRRPARSGSAAGRGADPWSRCGSWAPAAAPARPARGEHAQGCKQAAPHCFAPHSAACSPSRDGSSWGGETGRRMQLGTAGGNWGEPSP